MNRTAFKASAFGLGAIIGAFVLALILRPGDRRPEPAAAPHPLPPEEVVVRPDEEVPAAGREALPAAVPEALLPVGKEAEVFPNERAELQVTVFSAKRAPLKDAVVSLGPRFSSDGASKAVTGEAGTVRFERLLPGVYVIRAGRPGMPTVREEVQGLAAGEKRAIELCLMPPDHDVIELRILSADDEKPVGAARCQLGLFTGETDGQGCLLLPVPAGAEDGCVRPDILEHGATPREEPDPARSQRAARLAVEANARGFASHEEQLDLTDLPPRQIVVRLARGERICGEFRSTEGALLSDVRFYLWDSKGKHFGGLRTSADGRFELTCLPPGETWCLYAMKKGYVHQKVRGLKSSLAGPGVQVVLEAGHSLEVRLLDDIGNPVSGVDIDAHFEYGGEQSGARATTNEGGACVLEDLARGVAVITLSRQGFLREKHTVDVPAAEPLTIVLDRGLVLSVRVVDDNDQPVQEATVRLVGFSSARSNNPSELRTSAEGRAAFGGIAEPARLKIEVSKEGYKRAEAEGEAGSEVTVCLNRGGVITFNLVAGSASLPWLADLTFMNRSTLSSRRLHDVPVVDGRIEVSGLDAGTYDVTIELEGFAAAGVDKLEVGDAGRRIVDVLLEVGGELSGTVYDRETGLPMPDVEVEVSATRPARIRESTRTGHDGSYSFGNILGEVSVGFSHDNRCFVRLPRVTVPDGGHVVLEPVYLIKGGTILCRVVNIPEGVTNIGIGMRPAQGYGTYMGGGCSEVRHECTRTFRNMKPETYAVSARAGERRVSKHVVLPSGVDEVEVLLDFEEKQ
jgi:hypothetical protein